MYILNNEDNKRLFVGVTYLQLPAFGAFLKRILMVEKRAGDVRIGTLGQLPSFREFAKINI